MSNVRTPFQPIDFKTRFPALDGIRALAVTMVFLTHFGGGAHGGALLRAFNLLRNRMGIGVDLFFVLSGFLITGILFDTRRDSRFFRRFFARRSVRIFPVFYLLFAVLALLTPLLHYRWKLGQLSFLVYLGNLFANRDFSLYELHSATHSGADVTLSHLWSLCVEEQFYLVWPLVVWLVRDRVKLLWTCAGLCAATLLLRVYLVAVWPPETAQLWLLRALPFRLDDLLLGGGLALLLRGPQADRVQRACTWLFLSGLGALVWIAAVTPDFGAPLFLTLGLTVTGLCSAGLIGMTLNPASAAHRIFGIAPARLLGKYSYGFYVWHLVWVDAWIQVLIFMNHHTGSVVLGGLITLPLAFATTFLIAKLSYDCFEVRFLKYKRSFEYDAELRTQRTAFAADGN